MYLQDLLINKKRLKYKFCLFFQNDVFPEKKSENILAFRGAEYLWTGKLDSGEILFGKKQNKNHSCFLTEKKYSESRMKAADVS